MFTIFKLNWKDKVRAFDLKNLLLVIDGYRIKSNEIKNQFKNDQW